MIFFCQIDSYLELGNFGVHSVCRGPNVLVIMWYISHTGWFFWLVRPIFSTKMKNDGQPIRDSVPWNSRCTKDPRWLNNVFLFSTEIWVEQLKKAPCRCISVPNESVVSCTRDSIPWFQDIFTFTFQNRVIAKPLSLLVSRREWKPKLWHAHCMTWEEPTINS